MTHCVRAALLAPLSLLALSAGGCAETTQEEPPPDVVPGADDTSADDGPGELPRGDDDRNLRLMTFNIKRAAESSIEDIGAVIRAHDVDVVMLQEVDREAVRSNLVDQAYRIGQLTGMASSFRYTVAFETGGHYGLAVLSRHPIISSTKTWLVADGEPRAAIIWRIELPGAVPIFVGNTHLSTDDDQRADQLPQLADVLAAETPDFVMGDFNVAGGDRSLDPITDLGYADSFVEAGRGAGDSFPAENPSRRIDMIYASSSWIVDQVHVVETVASDHRPVVADVRLATPDE